MSEIQRTIPALTDIELARFRAKIAPRMSPDGCEEWTGAHLPEPNHYGTVRIRQRLYYAHRISYELHHGAIPPGLRVCHRCDNPPCTRGSHLFAGTAKDNSVDMRDKGRWRNRRMAGSLNGAAKLNEDQVRAIRAAYAGGSRQVDLADDFGVTQALISLIVRREAWLHVEPTPVELRCAPAIAEQYADTRQGGE